MYRKDDEILGTLIAITPEHASKKRTSEGIHKEQYKNVTHSSYHPLLPRELIGIIVDDRKEFGFHHVYGHTKHWFDKDFMKLKKDQVLTNLKWWVDKNVNHYEVANDNEESTVLDSFYEELMEETQNIEDSIKDYENIVLNILNKEALASIINRTKDDAATSFLYNLMHFQKLTVYKAECPMVAFETVTVFENDGVVSGELILVAGEKMEWRSMVCQT